MVEPRGVTMEDFTLLKMIGKGSYGKVLLVKKNDTEEVFAMKMLKKDYIARRNQIEHTRTERSILEKVNHPYIVKLRYAFQNPKKLYFVLEYCPGGELFFHLSRAGKFEEPRALFYAACVVLALEHLHRINVVYRDLKPENILIDSQGYAKITDFGLSKENIMDNASARTFCGTPEYLAPEVLARQGHGKAVDWWSLGALIFEMLTGLPPFYNAKDRERMFQDIMQSEVRFPAYISANARSLLEQLFVKDPAARLGGSARDADEIKEHPWFSGINWPRMMTREEIPPFIPSLDSIFDTKYVDSVGNM
jgi:protein-serine/threonine kinase